MLLGADKSPVGGKVAMGVWRLVVVVRVAEVGPVDMASGGVVIWKGGPVLGGVMGVL